MYTSSTSEHTILAHSRPFSWLAILALSVCIPPEESRAAILNSTGVAPNEQTGHSVALLGDVAVTGAVGTSTGTFPVYLYRGVDTATGTVNESLTLTASDTFGGDSFGRALSIGSQSGGTVVIGARGGNGTVNGSGAAYAYRGVNSGTGLRTENLKLIASDGAAGDSFGEAISSELSRTLIGAREHGTGGAAYLYRGLNAGSGTITETAKLIASDAVVNDRFGESVSMDLGRGLVGASTDNHSSLTNVGSVYVFTNLDSVTGTVTETGKLIASDPGTNDNFGASVSLDGTNGLVGAALHDTGGLVNSGKAYLYRDLDTNNGTAASPRTEDVQLIASDGAAQDRFGRKVSLSGDNALVGTSETDNGGQVSTGTVYVYTGLNDVATGSQVTENVRLTSSSGVNSNDRFGVDVSLDGDNFVIGARGDEDPSDNQPINGGIAFTGQISTFTTLSTSNATRATDGISFASNQDWTIGLNSNGSTVTLSAGDTADVSGHNVIIGDSRDTTGGGSGGIGSVGVAGASANNNVLVQEGTLIADNITVGRSTGFLQPATDNSWRVEAGAVATIADSVRVGFGGGVNRNTVVVDGTVDAQFIRVGGGGFGSRYHVTSTGTTSGLFIIDSATGAVRIDAGADVSGALFDLADYNLNPINARITGDGEIYAQVQNNQTWARDNTTNTLTLQQLTIGNDAAGNTLTQNDTLVVENVTVGSGTNGDINTWAINSTADVTNEVRIGAGGAFLNEIQVNNGGTLLADSVNVGFNSSPGGNSLVIQSGGSLGTATDLVRILNVGSNSSANTLTQNGELWVDQLVRVGSGANGFDNTWTINDTASATQVTVGQGVGTSNNRVTINDGGVLLVSDVLRLGVDQSSLNTLEVKENGSLGTSDNRVNSVEIGNSSSGNLLIQSGEMWVGDVVTVGTEMGGSENTWIVNGEANVSNRVELGSGTTGPSTTNRIGVESSGTLTANTLSIGVSDLTTNNLVRSDGTIDVNTINVGNAVNSGNHYQALTGSTTSGLFVFGTGTGNRVEIQQGADLSGATFNLANLVDGRVQGISTTLNDNGTTTTFDDFYEPLAPGETVALTTNAQVNQDLTWTGADATLNLTLNDLIVGNGNQFGGHTFTQAEDLTLSGKVTIGNNSQGNVLGQDGELNAVNVTIGSGDDGDDNFWDVRDTATITDTVLVGEGNGAERNRVLINNGQALTTASVVIGKGINSDSNEVDVRGSLNAQSIIVGGVNNSDNVFIIDGGTVTGDVTIINGDFNNRVEIYNGSDLAGASFELDALGDNRVLGINNQVGGAPVAITTGVRVTSDATWTGNNINPSLDLTVSNLVIGDSPTGVTFTQGAALDASNVIVGGGSQAGNNTWAINGVANVAGAVELGAAMDGAAANSNNQIAINNVGEQRGELIADTLTIGSTNSSDNNTVTVAGTVDATAINVGNANNSGNLYQVLSSGISNGNITIGSGANNRVEVQSGADLTAATFNLADLGNGRVKGIDPLVPGDPVALLTQAQVAEDQTWNGADSSLDLSLSLLEIGFNGLSSELTQNGDLDADAVQIGFGANGDNNRWSIFGTASATQVTVGQGAGSDFNRALINDGGALLVTDVLRLGSDQSIRSTLTISENGSLGASDNRVNLVQIGNRSSFNSLTQRGEMWVGEAVTVGTGMDASFNRWSIYDDANVSNRVELGAGTTGPNTYNQIMVFDSGTLTANTLSIGVSDVTTTNFVRNEGAINVNTINVGNALNTGNHYQAFTGSTTSGLFTIGTGTGNRVEIQQGADLTGATFELANLTDGRVKGISNVYNDNGTSIITDDFFDPPAQGESINFATNAQVSGNYEWDGNLDSTLDVDFLELTVKNSAEFTVSDDFAADNIIVGDVAGSDGGIVTTAVGTELKAKTITVGGVANSNNNRFEVSSTVELLE